MEPNFCCTFCKSTFTHKKLLDKHKQENHTFECEYCNFIFRSRELLSKHILNMHKCNICAITFSSPAHLTNHKKTKHTRKKVYSCDLCNESFSKKVAVTKHRKTHAVKKIRKHNSDTSSLQSSYIFVDCGKEMKKEVTEEIVVDYDQQHEIKEEVIDDDPLCVEEKHISGDSENILELVKDDFNDIPRSSEIVDCMNLFQCDLCGKSFLNSIRLKSHEKIHQLEKPLMGNISITNSINFTNCGQNKEEGLNKELVIVNDVNEKLKNKVINDFSEDMIKDVNKETLMDSNIITDIKKEVIDNDEPLCVMEIKNSDNCENKLADANVEDIDCNIPSSSKFDGCSGNNMSIMFSLSNKDIQYKSLLKSHGNDHKLERSYSCNLCGKTFFEMKNFKQHVKTHEKPYSCSVCGKSFSVEYKLTIHKLIHFV